MKAIRLTSLVISMEQKKTSSTSSMAFLRRLMWWRSSFSLIQSKNPASTKPCTVIIRQKSMAMVCQSI